VARLDRMVANILLSTQLEAHALRPEVGPVELDALVRASVDRKRLLFAERGGTLDARLQPSTARFNREALEVVLENLLDNALKYSVGAPHVRIESRTVDRTIELRVSDEGVGIGPDELPHLFEKFYRAPAGEQVSAKGTGLGLFIARGLARAAGGDLVAQSDGPGKGATFTIRMPA
jgi:signal transduction histidine kinase